MCEIKKHINGSSLLVWDLFESKIVISAKTETPGKLPRNWINHTVLILKKLLLMIFTIFKKGSLMSDSVRHQDVKMDIRILPLLRACF